MRTLTVGTVLVALMAAAATAMAAGSAVEMKAIGPYENPHKITVGTGDVVQVGVYIASAVASLSSFQTDLSFEGPGAVESVGRGAWFSAGGKSDGRVTFRSNAGLVRVLGYCMADPVAVEGTGDLAVLNVRFDGPGPVTLGVLGDATELVGASGEPLGVAPAGATVLIEREPCECYDGNGNREVDFPDIAAFSGAYGSTAGSSSYNADYDANGDGAIGWEDIGVLSGCYGKNW